MGTDRLVNSLRYSEDMFNHNTAEPHLQSWLTRMAAEGRLVPDHEGRTRFSDLYALYRSTTTGDYLGRSWFSILLDLKGVMTVIGAGNVRYKAGIRMPGTSTPPPHTCECGRTCWGSPA